MPCLKRFPIKSDANSTPRQNMQLKQLRECSIDCCTHRHRRHRRIEWRVRHQSFLWQRLGPCRGHCGCTHPLCCGSLVLSPSLAGCFALVAPPWRHILLSLLTPSIGSALPATRLDDSSVRFERLLSFVALALGEPHITLYLLHWCRLSHPGPATAACAAASATPLHASCLSGRLRLD